MQSIDMDSGKIWIQKLHLFRSYCCRS